MSIFYTTGFTLDLYTRIHVFIQLPVETEFKPYFQSKLDMTKPYILDNYKEKGVLISVFRCFIFCVSLSIKIRQSRALEKKDKK